MEKVGIWVIVVIVQVLGKSPYTLNPTPNKLHIERLEHSCLGVFRYPRIDDKSVWNPKKGHARTAKFVKVLFSCRVMLGLWGAGLRGCV